MVSPPCDSLLRCQTAPPASCCLVLTAVCSEEGERATLMSGVRLSEHILAEKLPLLPDRRRGEDGSLSFSLTNHAPASYRRRGGATQKQLQHPRCRRREGLSIVIPTSESIPLVLRPVPFCIYLADFGGKVYNFVICGLLSLLNMTYCPEQFLQVIVTFCFHSEVSTF